MTTTCADVLTRAVALSVANQGLIDSNVTADVQETLNRINQLQTNAFTRFTAKNKVGFLGSAVRTSTSGNGGRTIDLSGVTPRLQRIVRVTLPSGVEVSLVDPNVPQAELAPRYYMQGETIVEVMNDWDTSTASAVSLTILASSRATDLDVSATGALSQLVSVPDRYTSILVYGLGAYLAEKDVGREDEEVADLTAKSDAALDAWIESATLFGGVPVYSFEVPTPSVTSKD